MCDSKGHRPYLKSIVAGSSWLMALRATEIRELIKAPVQIDRRETHEHFDAGGDHRAAP